MRLLQFGDPRAADPLGSSHSAHGSNLSLSLSLIVHICQCTEIAGIRACAHRTALAFRRTSAKAKTKLFLQCLHLQCCCRLFRFSSSYLSLAFRCAARCLFFAHRTCSPFIRLVGVIELALLDDGHMLHNMCLMFFFIIIVRYICFIHYASALWPVP